MGLTFLTVGGQVILISQMVPPSPMEFAVLLFGIILHMLEFLVWYFWYYFSLFKMGKLTQSQKALFLWKSPLAKLQWLFIFSLWNIILIKSPLFLYSYFYITIISCKIWRNKAKADANVKTLKAEISPVLVAKAISRMLQLTLMPKTSTKGKNSTLKESKNLRESNWKEDGQRRKKLTNKQLRQPNWPWLSRQFSKSASSLRRVFIILYWREMRKETNNYTNKSTKDSKISIKICSPITKTSPVRTLLS